MKLIKLYSIDFYSEADKIIESDRLIVEGMDRLQMRNPWLCEMAELSSSVRYLCTEVNGKYGTKYIAHLGRHSLKVTHLVRGRERLMGQLEINFRQSLDVPIGSFLWDLDLPPADPWRTNRAACEHEMRHVWGEPHRAKGQAVEAPLLVIPEPPTPPPAASRTAKGRAVVALKRLLVKGGWLDSFGSPMPALGEIPRELIPDELWGLLATPEDARTPERRRKRLTQATQADYHA